MSHEAAAPDTRPTTDVTLEVLDADARRGGALHVRGALTADGDPCADTPVTITLLSNNTAFPIGSVATDEHGRYDASITLNMSLSVGEYDVRAFTLGNTRCGEGTSK
jgi:5-hydroxyisourate hydrolase-like protein (transthyretin family)